MKTDFKNLTEVLEHVEETIVIDLLQHAVSLEEDPYLIALKDPVPGVYITGDLEPIINFNNIYYRKQQFGSKSGLIKNFEQVITACDDIVNEHAGLVLTHRNIKTKKRFLNPAPTVPAMAIKAAISVVQRYLNTLSHHMRYAGNTYRLENLIQDKYVSLIEKDEYLHAFEKLLDTVAEFVGKDHWNLYFYKLKGTSMIVTKGVDWRIYDWYRIQFEKENVSE